MSDNIIEEKNVIAENTLLATARCPDGSRTNRPKGKSRRMKLLERMGCFNFDSKTVRIERATTIEDFCGAFKLTHDSFVEENYIQPNSSGMRIRTYDVMPDSATFVAKAEGKIIGVTGAVIDSDDLGLPTDGPFQEEIEPLRKAGRKICEGTNWVITPEYRRSCVLTELTRCCLAHAMAVGCDDLLATVSPGHAPYYNLLGFETFSPERSYSEKINDPVVLLRLAIDGLDERFADVDINDGDDEALLKDCYIVNNPYHAKVEHWMDTSDACFSNPTFLKELLAEQTDFLAECSEKDLAIICRHWGEELFLDVLGHSLPCRSLALPSVDYISSLTKFCRRSA